MASILWTVLIGFIAGAIAKKLTPGRGPGGFVVRMEPTGTLRWSRGFAASGAGTVSPADLAIDDGTVAAMGVFYGTADFGEGPRAVAATGGAGDTFVAGFAP